MQDGQLELEILVKSTTKTEVTKVTNAANRTAWHFYFQGKKAALWLLDNPTQNSAKFYFTIDGQRMVSVITRSMVNKPYGITAAAVFGLQAGLAEVGESKVRAWAVDGFI